MPLISVLIPTFNQQTYVAEAIRSALDQDYPDIEVVVCDDASTDSTAETLRAFENHSRVSVHTNAANLGRTGNYRKCLFELARGEWAIVLDGDDYFSDTGYLSKAMKAALAEPDVDLVFANAVRVKGTSTGSDNSETRKPGDFAASHEGQRPVHAACVQQNNAVSQYLPVAKRQGHCAGLLPREHHQLRLGITPSVYFTRESGIH